MIQILKFESILLDNSAFDTDGSRAIMLPILVPKSIILNLVVSWFLAFILMHPFNMIKSTCDDWLLIDWLAIVAFVLTVRRASKRFGFKEVGEDDDWNLYWTDLSVSLERVMDMKRYQVTHYSFQYNFNSLFNSSLVLWKASQILWDEGGWGG